MSPCFYLTIKRAKSVQRKNPEQNERGGEKKRKFTGYKITDIHSDDHELSKLTNSSLSNHLQRHRFILSGIECFIYGLCSYLYFAFHILLT